MSQLDDAANATSAWIDALSGVLAIGFMAMAVVCSVLVFSFLIGNKERQKPKRKGSPIRVEKGNSGSTHSTHSPRSRDDDCGSYGGHGGCSSSGDSGGDGGGCGGGGD